MYENFEILAVDNGTEIYCTLCSTLIGHWEDGDDCILFDVVYEASRHGCPKPAPAADEAPRYGVFEHKTGRGFIIWDRVNRCRAGVDQLTYDREADAVEMAAYWNAAS